jgi:hypothetical protein
MHFGGERARLRQRRARPRLERLFWMDFGEIFYDRKRVPYDDVAIVGHLPEGDTRKISSRVLSCASGIMISSNAMP